MIAAILSVESLFYSPRGQQRNQAAAAHKRFTSSEGSDPSFRLLSLNYSSPQPQQKGDHITYINIFQGYLACEKKKQWCLQNFINFRAMKQADVSKIYTPSLQRTG